MEMGQLEIMEEADEHLVIVDEAAGDVGVVEALVCHCPVV